MKLTGLIRTTFAFVIVSVIIGAVLYNRLPDPVPTGFMAKPASVFLTPVAIALLGFLFAALPRISPKGYRLDSFLRVYEIIAITVLTVEFVDGMLGLYIALGHDLDVERVGTIGLGVLLLVLGNFMGKVTRNFFVGIRTPWTLASKEVWFRTHRIGGVLFVVGGGIILIASVVASNTPVVALAVILGIAFFLTVHSYVVYHRIEAGDPGADES
jgi:uncharacterized membrane protein